MPLLWDEMRQENVTLRMPTTFNTIRLLKEKSRPWFF